jgi:membrane protease YdiL (CAAX protease family)
MSALDRAQRRFPLAVVATLLGGAVLPLRPALVREGVSASQLAIGYVVVALLALAATVPAAPAADLGPATPLVVGLIAVAVVSLLGGTPRYAAIRPAAFVLSVLAAVSEELVFRRALYGWLCRYGPVLAVTATAAAFAVVHVPAYGVNALPVDLGAGLLLSWQRWASGSWTVPAITHVSANVLAVLL